ncbi:MAG: hypothetical protein U1E05_03280 [Patescibacteria group bacterium]|nr:hypothetical protein [Patescibacteria group bacterium]
MAGGWPVGVLFALLGAGAAWGLFQTYHPVFRVPAELASIEMPNSRQAAEIRAAEIKAGLLNALLVLGWTGALLAGAMAAGQACARRSWRIALFGMIGCGLAGALFGALAGWAGHVVYHLLLIPFEGATDLKRTVVVQAVMLGTLCGGVGLVLGALTGFGRAMWTRLLGGVLAGISAGMVFPFVAGYFFPKTHVGYVLPRDGTGAILWLTVTAICFGLIVPELTLRRTCDARGDDEVPVPEESAAPLSG